MTSGTVTEKPHEPGPVDPGEGQVVYSYSKEGKTPLILVVVWAIFFAFMAYYVGTYLVPDLIQELGKR